MSDLSENLNPTEGHSSPFSNGPFLKASLLQALKIHWAFTWRGYLYALALGFLFIPFIYIGELLLPLIINATFQDPTYNFILQATKLVGLVFCVSLILFTLFWFYKTLLSDVLDLTFKDFKVVLVQKEGRTLYSSTVILLFYNLIYYSVVIISFGFLISILYKVLIGNPTNIEIYSIWMTIGKILFDYFLLNYKRSILKIVPLTKEQ